MKDWWLRAVLWWVWAAIPITLLCLLIYVVGQQIYRQSANDPELQMATDAAAALSRGEAPASVVNYAGRPGGPLQDLATTYAPWLAIYDEHGTPLESTGQLYGAPPQPPKNVFANAEWWREGHTWQPQVGLRFSIIIVRYPSDGGNTSNFVVAGRSLALTEDRVMQLGFSVLLGWFVTLGTVLVVSVALQWLLRRSA